MRIYLIGFMGSGKSHTGKKLAELLKVPFFDLDQMIEDQQQKTISELFEKLGEDRFREIEQRTLHQTIAHKDAVISCGGGTPCFFDNMEWMNEHGVTIYLHTSEALLLERLIMERNKRPLLANSAGEELAGFINRLMEKRLPYYEQAQVIYHQRENEEDVAGFLFQYIDNKQITSTVD
jgi:shikimate kinase